MDPLKSCGLCGCTSNETAIFSCTYAKGSLEICLECLTEGIMEITNEYKKAKNVKKQTNSELIDDPMHLESFDFTVPEEVFGFNCEKCSTVLFSNTFPVLCDCGHLNNEVVLQKQDLMNRK